MSDKIVEFPEMNMQEVATEVAETVEPKGTVNFEGEEIKLKFPLYALMKLEDEFGVTMSDLEENSESISLITKLVWAGLLYKFPTITLDEVAMQFEITDLADIAGAISAGVTAHKGK